MGPVWWWRRRKRRGRIRHRSSGHANTRTVRSFWSEKDLILSKITRSYSSLSQETTPVKAMMQDITRSKLVWTLVLVAIPQVLPLSSCDSSEMMLCVACCVVCVVQGDDNGWMILVMVRGEWVWWVMIIRAKVNYNSKLRNTQKMPRIWHSRRRQH